MSDKAPKQKTQTQTPESQILGVLLPCDNAMPSRQPSNGNKKGEPSLAFREAFMKTMRHEGEGLMSPYLFYEENGRSRSLLKCSLYGGFAWDAHMVKSQSYSFADDDLAALDYAIGTHFLDKLPSHIKFIEYGPGGNSGVEKPKKLIQALMDSSDHIIDCYIGVDILSRYATESMQAIHEEFNLCAYGVMGDFMADAHLKIPGSKDSRAVPLVTIFGGPIANAPHYLPAFGQSSRENAIQYLSMIKDIHGPDVNILLTYDASRDKSALLKEYKPTREFSAFELSSFRRAVAEGIITDKNYNPETHWKLVPVYDEKAEAVKLCVECKKSHVLQTVDGPISIKKHEKFVNTLSYKWDAQDYKAMLREAGFDCVDISRAPNQTNGIVLARATPAP